MTRTIWFVALITAVCTSVAWADDKHDHHAMPKAATNAGFEKMKSLVGTWVKVGDDGKPTDEVFSVITDLCRTKEPSGR